MNARIHVMRAAAVAALLGMAAGPAETDAHGTRQVGGGKFEMVVGFLDEPVFAGDKSGLDLKVTYAPQGLETPEEGHSEEGGAPVTGLEETLDAEVIFGDERLALPLSAAWDEEGVYHSWFFPAEPGDYTFRITGEIEGVTIDESFMSTRDGFGAVRDPGPVTFPAAAETASADAASPRMLGALAGLPGLGVAAAAGGAALFLQRKRGS
ncbi:MAG: hypothetical protein ACKOWF_10250 [Chloroflexota bacterium]